jgi:AraC-like DNA-binding protein
MVPPRFVQCPPSAALSAWVECYWSLVARDAPPWRTRVLPDGSSDVIVDLAAAPRPFVVGPMRRAALVPLEGRVDLFGIRFRPGAALPFLDVPQWELRDRQVGLSALWGHEADLLADELASVSPRDRVGRMERVLLQKVRGRGRTDDLGARAVALLRRMQGRIAIGSVAGAMGCGTRRLERAFERSVGLSPKGLARVLRFLYSVRRIGQGREAPGAALALEAGYADQAHFVRDFRALAGVTPARYAHERRVGFVQDELTAPI